MRSRLTGRHVDENWYEIANLDFDFRLDLPLSSKLIDRSREVGLQVRAVDYEGFPVDTGTIVADRLINADGLPTAMYSCCVYSDYTETMTIGKVAADAVASVDGVTAIVVVSGLSGRYFTTEIDFSEDHVRDPGDDAWNKRILDWLAKGEWDRIRQVRDEYCRAAKVDMGLKALAFLEGAGVNHPRRHVETLAYGPIYGTGAAVMLGQRR
jgi:2-aminophenol/2-amino-5-chlorophenol 1,6-dioxygenase alpha subunit